jgi:hypothetical protein
VTQRSPAQRAFAMSLTAPGRFAVTQTYMRIVVLWVTLVGCGSVAGHHPDAGIDAAPGDASIDGPPCAANPAGLAGRWRGEMNPSDDTAAHNGTPIGNNLGYAPGQHGLAFLLDGATNVVSISDGDALWPAASFSVEAWVKTFASGNVISKYQCGGKCPSAVSTAYWALSVAGTGAAAFNLRTDAAQTIASVTDTLHDVHEGQWHHLVGVRDVPAATMTLYVDGALAVSANLPPDQLGAMTNTDGETDPVVIGGSQTAGATTYEGFLKGAIDDVSYYTSALTATQVSAIYHAPDGECH